MKKNVCISLGLSVLMLIMSVWFMWNTAIAADEQITVSAFLDKYNFMYWGYLVISLLLLISNFILLKKKNKNQYFSIDKCFIRLLMNDTILIVCNTLIIVLFTQELYQSQQSVLFL